MLQAGGDPLTPAKWMVWDRSPLAKERSLAVSAYQSPVPAFVVTGYLTITALCLGLPMIACTL